MVVPLGTQYIHSYIWDCIFAGIHFSFTGYFCAYGKSYIGFIPLAIALTLGPYPDPIWLPEDFPHALFWREWRRQVLLSAFGSDLPDRLFLVETPCRSWSCIQMQRRFQWKIKNYFLSEK